MVFSLVVPFLVRFMFTLLKFLNCRSAGEDSDVDCYRDSSSSDGSSDYEHEKGLKYSRAWSPNHLTSTSNLRMDRLSLKEKHVASQEGSSSDDGDSGSSQGHLLFEFLERDPPYIREPLADKVCLFHVTDQLNVY